MPPTPGSADIGLDSFILRLAVGSESTQANDLLAFAPDGTLYFSKRGGGLFRGCTYLSAGTPGSSTDGGFCYASDPQIFSGNVKGVAFALEEPGITTNPDLWISKSASSPTLVAGNQMNYTLVVRNIGAVTASGVVVTDTLPANVTFLSATTTRNETCPAPAGTLFQCALAPINTGARVDVIIRVQGNANAVGSIQNRASVGGSQPDTDTTNNNALNVVSGISPTPTSTPTRTPRPILTTTPTPAGLSKVLFWNSPTGIKVLRLSDNYSWDFTTPHSCPLGVAVDPARSRLYWTQCDGTIHSANLDGSNANTILQNQKNPTSIVVDSVGGNIYWRTNGDPNRNPEPPRIYRADLNGSNIELLLTTQSPNAELALDTVGQQLFWRDGWNILRAELNGADAQSLVSSAYYNGLVIDGGARKLYWGSSTDFDGIARADLGIDMAGVQNVETVVRYLANSLALDAADNKLYWTDSGGIRVTDLRSLPAGVVTLRNGSVNNDSKLALAYLTTASVPTPTNTPTSTPTNTPTITSTPTNTSTPTITPTPSNTPTPTATPCASTGSISGKVFNDVNQNGVDDDEPGIAGVLIRLSNNSEATTNGSGLFQFNNLTFAQYLVFETDPPGAASTTSNVNSVLVAPCAHPVVTFGDYFPPTPTPTTTSTRLPATPTPTQSVQESVLERWLQCDPRRGHGRHKQSPDLHELQH